MHVSAENDHDLFKASLCGLGATGVIIDVQVEVEPAFRLRETKEGRELEDVLENLDEIKGSAEHVRLWWYPDGEGVVVGRANRTQDVSGSVRNLLSVPARPAHVILDGGLSGLSLDTILPLHLPIPLFSHPVGW